MGICFEKEDDEKLARGWPNLVVAVDGDKADKSPAKRAMKAFTASDAVMFTVWPRQVLMRYLRIHAAVLDDGDDADIIEAAADVAEPLSAADALTALGRMVNEGDVLYPFNAHAFVYGVETLAGTDAVLETLSAAVDAMRKPSSGSTPSEGTQTALLETIAFLLLRASPKAAKKARTQLEKTYARITKWQEQATALDLSLHGTEAVKRHIGPEPWFNSEGGLLGYAPAEFADDAAYVREIAKRVDPTDAMTVRIPAIAGLPVLAGLEKRKWPAAQMPAIVRDFGMIRAPEVVALMLSLIGKTSVKDAPMTWFQSHADYARPILEKTKSAASKLVLRQLA